MNGWPRRRSTGSPNTTGTFVIRIGSAQRHGGILTTLKKNRRQREARINSFPNFKVNIEDDGEVLQVHFAALFSKKKDAIPLLFMHGWPGRFGLHVHRKNTLDSLH